MAVDHFDLQLFFLGKKKSGPSSDSVLHQIDLQLCGWTVDLFSMFAVSGTDQGRRETHPTGIWNPFAITPWPNSKRGEACRVAHSVYFVSHPVRGRYVCRVIAS